MYYPREEERCGIRVVGGTTRLRVVLRASPSVLCDDGIPLHTKSRALGNMGCCLRRRPGRNHRSPRGGKPSRLACRWSDRCACWGR
jgi:hypothetical protein